MHGRRAALPPIGDRAARASATGNPGATSGARAVLDLQRAAGNAALAGALGGARGPLTVQRYEAWEHREIADAAGGADRVILLPNGVRLTYGQIVALSGDFYRSPEALLNSSAGELRSVLAVMDRERGEAAPHADGSGGLSYAPTPGQVNANNADYEMATTGHSRRAASEGPLGGDADTAGGSHGEVRQGEHVESGAPGADAGFFDLAADNPAHFSPDNIRLNWTPKHRLALDLARQGWQVGHPGRPPAPTPGVAAAPTPGARPDPLATRTQPGTSDSTAGGAEAYAARAWLASGFSDHFLTDAFAAGHLVSGDAGRALCRAFYDAHRNDVRRACTAAAIADGVPVELAVSAVPAVLAGLDEKISSLLLKVVHDHYNGTGVEVRNALGDQWRATGDGHLGGHPEAIAMAERASKASRDAVDETLASGGTSRPEAALQFVPAAARLAAGPFLPVETFAADPAVFAPALAEVLLPDPANPLYAMVKGNIVPVGGVEVRKSARAVGESVEGGARAVGRTVRGAAREVVEAPQRWFRDLENAIRNLYGAP